MSVSTILKHRYRILQELGGGAFGQTFVAEDLDLPSRQCCVLKQLKPIADARQYRFVQDRFEREAAVLEKLSAEAKGGVPRLYAYFTEDDKFYLVQEWVDGRTLKQVLAQEGRWDETSVRACLRALLDILEYVHSKGIIHRDIKPENIMIRNGDRLPVLIDFGIVKEVVSGDGLGDGTSSIVAGTPAFMALEQAAGKPVFASDLYSVGMTAINMLTGRNPQSMSDMTTGTIRWHEFAPEVSPGLERVIRKATEPYLRDRYKTVQDMMADLDAPAHQHTRAFGGAEELDEMPTTIPSGVLQELSTVAPGGIAVAVGAVPATAAPATTDTAMTGALELAFWESIKDSHNPRSFQAYLDKFPSGQFSILAGIKLEELMFVAKDRKEPFQFDTVTLDEKGTIVDFRTLKSQHQVEDLGGGVLLEMVPIASGVFQMGSTDTDTEKPVHQVRLSSFSIGKYPITQAQWRMVAAMPTVVREIKADPSFKKGDERPVEQVSWDDALEFCARLSSFTGKTYRLPTEAEWEYACRAGTQTPFAFGETLTADIANIDGTFPYKQGPKGRYLGETLEVGKVGAANAFGLYDMHGNVWEWCLDAWHDNYNGAPGNGMAWEGRNENRRVIRGGSWIETAARCRSAFRGSAKLEARNAYTGFRVVLADDSKAEMKNRTTSGNPVYVPPAASLLPPLPPPPPPLPTAAIQNARPLPPGIGPVGAGPSAGSIHVPAFASLPKTLSLELALNVRLDFVLIAPGAFDMGGLDYENEKPIHRVSFSNPFFMGAYPVTQAQWKAIAGNNPSSFKNPERPVENVSWTMAQDFIASLNRKIEGYRFRLPSEAEWEYVCRAGSAMKYCCGDGKNLLNEHAWFDENARGMTQPVGRKKPNAWGLYDMHGNVYEWCLDEWHESYQGAPENGEAWGNSERAEYRVLRGGSWAYYAAYCRSAFRYRSEPTTVKNNIGFRLVLEPLA
jgi:formylglycine-generating enzyme required for sulfatase activity